MQQKTKAILLALSIIASVSLANADFLQLQPGSLDFSGIYDLRQDDPNLTGQDVVITAVCRSYTYQDGLPLGDFAIDTNHPCFADKNITIYGKSSYTGISPHSTAIASILLGEDSDANHPGLGQFYYEGVIPQSQLNIHEYWQFVKNNLLKSNLPKTDIITMSIGTVFEDWWTRGFEYIAQQGIVVVAGIGNGTSAQDQLLYPAASANVIGVGVADCIMNPDLEIALSNFGLANTEHSSCGPTIDGRGKPDIIAPGNCIVATVDGKYKVSGDYSSFATPLVAGTSGLLIQAIKENKNYQSRIRQSSMSILIKAILMNSAEKLPYWHKGMPTKDDDHTVAVDFVQGAGMLDATAAMETLVSQNSKIGWDCDVIASDEMSYLISTQDVNDTSNIVATLVWNNQYKPSYPFELELQGDLRLELWAVDSNDQNKNYMVDHSDTAGNVVEHIYIPADSNFSDYKLVVKNNIPDSNESFAIAWQVRESVVSEDWQMLYYDLTGDGSVDNRDVIKLLKNMGREVQMPLRYIIGDLNMNGKIDQSDLDALMTFRSSVPNL